MKTQRIHHHRWIYAIWLIIALSGLSSCAQKPEFRIGLILPLSGDVAQMGAAARNAAQLAADEINEAGGLTVGNQRYQITLIIEDDQNRPEEATAAAQRLINQQNVVALIGPLLDHTAIPVAAIAERARIPMISPSSTAPETTAGRRYVYRTTYTSGFQGEVMTRFTLENLSSRTTPRAVVLYNIADPYSVGIAEVFRTAYREAGGDLKAYETYTTDMVDFTPQFTRIKEAAGTDLEIVVLPNAPNEVALQVAQARRMGIYFTTIAGDALNEINPGQYPDLNRLFLVAPWHPDIEEPRAQTFTTAYQTAYASTPSSAAALTYDALQLLFAAAQNQGGVEPESINTGMATLGRYEGVTGIITYQGSGDPEKSAVILQIIGDRFALVRTFSP